MSAAKATTSTLCRILIPPLRNQKKKGHPLEVPVKHKIPFHGRFSTTCLFPFSLIGSALIPIAERLLPSGSSSRGLPRDSSRGCSVTHLDLGCRRRRQPPALCAASPFRYCGTRKPSVPVHRPFSQSGLPSVPHLRVLRVSRPLGAGNGATAFQTIELGRRRIPISPLVLPDPFPVPGGIPFIQTSAFHQNPFRSLHATSPWPTCRPALFSP
ncbi:hypothetical protein PDESU_05159 [Pontiella desulfatans]|uniref:Uncharacterized protein n=1 Tax=Pontiella desulfatans TaxID=2750659 RepID=A0A6C2U8Z0_PONDE|nr:hypothetical protein PDESU_05159 [Pontiella desulfatans]